MVAAGDQTRPHFSKFRDLLSGLAARDFDQRRLAVDFGDLNPEALIATGLNRMYPDETNAAVSGIEQHVFRFCQSKCTTR